MSMREGDSIVVEDGIVVNTAGVFYNSFQRVARDFLALALRVVDGKTFLDAFSASGIRALRAAKIGYEATAVDISEIAVRRIEENAKRNGLEVEILRTKAEEVLARRKFDFIDLDPFGNPVKWIKQALLSAKKFLTVTATDTAVLCGVYPRVSVRRYGSFVVKTHNYHEIGVRNLIGYVVRMAASLDIAAIPVFAHGFKHYYRAFFEIRKGAKRAEKMLENVGIYLGYIGPIWLDRLWNRDFLKRMEKASRQIEMWEKSREILKVILEESDFEGFYVDIHELSSRLKINVPKFSEILEVVEASRTHFTPRGLRGNSEGEIIEALLSIGKR